jgi:hypothetical protein
MFRREQCDLRVAADGAATFRADRWSRQAASGGRMLPTLPAAPTVKIGMTPCTAVVMHGQVRAHAGLRLGSRTQVSHTQVRLRLWVWSEAG